MKIIFYYVIFPLYRPIYLVSVVINTFLLGSLIIILSPLDHSGNFVHYIGKFWSRLNLHLAFCRVKVRGKEQMDPGKAYIVMSNHQSFFDVWALIACLPLQLRWVVKAEIRKMPVFGLALQRMGHMYVDRVRGNSLRRSIEKAALKVKDSTSVALFPEGTRSEDGALLKFRRGGFVLAQKSGCPILPITVNGSRFVLPKNTLDLMPGRIEIRIHRPIECAGALTLDETLLAVEKAIREGLDSDYGRRS
jgi:1-acyl-sn-glycerol-3-phosphate acyltransferase